MPSTAARLATDKIVIYYAAMAWFLVLFIGYFYLHEMAGHYLGNLVSGVTPAHLSVQWVRFFGLPLFPISVTLHAGEPSLWSKLAGGLVAGMILLGVSFAWRRAWRRYDYTVLWWLFIVSLGFALSGLLEGFMEGFFNEYHRRSGELLVLVVLTFLLPPVAGAWHFRATIRGMLRKQERQDESG